MTKEFGSDFHFVSNYVKSDTFKPISQFILGNKNFYFSGRGALYSIIQQGIDKYGWKRFFFPEYFCQEVIESIKHLPIDIRFFKDGPYQTEIKKEIFNGLDKAENAFLLVNFYGLQSKRSLPLKSAYIIEDHTHDIISEWSLNSNADYCIASLRKTMPIPSGGLAWSPKNLSLPIILKKTNLSTELAFQLKLSGMLLKQLYLKNYPVVKNDFRKLYLDAEVFFTMKQTFGYLPDYGKKIIESIPIGSLRSQKLSNYNLLIRLLEGHFTIFNLPFKSNQCPLGLILLFDSEADRDNMKIYLIQNNVFPAVIWPSQIFENAQRFSNMMLLIHCDFRYSEDNIEQLSRIINQYNKKKLYKI